MLTFTPRCRTEAEERADREVKKRLLWKLELAQLRLEGMSRCTETAEQIVIDPNDTENLKKQLLVLMECCVDSGKYFKSRLYKLYTIRVKSIDDRLMIRQCESYLDTTYKEWKMFRDTYKDLITSDNSPCELTMKHFWR